MIKECNHRIQTVVKKEYYDYFKNKYPFMISRFFRCCLVKAIKNPSFFRYVVFDEAFKEL